MGLAGPKVKQRINADPRNTAWVNDKNKVGLKLMQKMGWSEGKGLGANENGSTENIRLLQKDNQLGVGATKRTIDNWLDNTDAFSQVLASLNSAVETSVPATSLVDSTESSRSSIRTHGRLAHRTKFLKAKNLSTLAEDKHLNDILGLKKSTESSDKKAKVESRADSITTTSQLSVHDYFAQKMAKFNMNSKESGSARNSKIDENDQNERMGMGLGFSSCSVSAVEQTVIMQSSTEISASQTVVVTNTKKRKRDKSSSREEKKKRKRDKDGKDEKKDKKKKKEKSKSLKENDDGDKKSRSGKKDKKSRRKERKEEGKLQ